MRRKGSSVQLSFPETAATDIPDHPVSRTRRSPNKKSFPAKSDETLLKQHDLFTAFSEAAEKAVFRSFPKTGHSTRNPLPDPNFLAANKVRLTPVSFTPEMTPDQWLYMVCEAENAQMFLSQGLRPNPEQPPRLVERPSVAACLAHLAENDEQHTLSSLAVLRIRRMEALNAIEPDPDTPGFWLLTGGLTE